MLVLLSLLLTRSCAYVRFGSGCPLPKSGRGTPLWMDSGLAPSSFTKIALAYGPEDRHNKHRTVWLVQPTIERSLSHACAS